MQEKLRHYLMPKANVVLCSYNFSLAMNSGQSVLALSWQRYPLCKRESKKLATQKASDQKYQKACDTLSGILQTLLAFDQKFHRWPPECAVCNIAPQLSLLNSCQQMTRAILFWYVSTSLGESFATISAIGTQAAHGS